MRDEFVWSRAMRWAWGWFYVCVAIGGVLQALAWATVPVLWFLAIPSFLPSSSFLLVAAVPVAFIAHSEAR